VLFVHFGNANQRFVRFYEEPTAVVLVNAHKFSNAMWIKCRSVNGTWEHKDTTVQLRTVNPIVHQCEWTVYSITCPAVAGMTQLFLAASGDKHDDDDDGGSGFEAGPKILLSNLIEKI
jgi:hypothetical protein